MNKNTLIQKYDLKEGDTCYVISWKPPIDVKHHIPLYIIFKQHDEIPIVDGTLSLDVAEYNIRLVAEVMNMSNNTDLGHRVRVDVYYNNIPTTALVCLSNGYTYSRNVGDFMSIESHLF